jgi:hypothetical protein
MNRPPADVFGQALMDDPPQSPVRFLSQVAEYRVQGGSGALGTSDRGGQDKELAFANSLIVSRETFVGTLALEPPRLAVNDIPSGRMAPFERRGISTARAMALADFNSMISAFHSIACASLRSL